MTKKPNGQKVIALARSSSTVIPELSRLSGTMFHDLP